MSDAIFIGGTKRLKQSPCPVCRADLDGITCTSLDQMPDRGTLPEAGDFTICVYCAAILRFDMTFRVRVATLEDLKEAQAGDPKKFAMLQKMHAAADQLQRSRRRKKDRYN